MSRNCNLPFEYWSRYQLSKSCHYNNPLLYISSAFPSPKLSDTPRRSSSTNYKLTSVDKDKRSRSKSPPLSPSRTYERSRSHERAPRPEGTYEIRSRSYDRRPPARSVSHEVTTTTGYGSLTSSIGLRNSLGNTDLNVRSMPDSGPRYCSNLTELGPTPGETKEERRKRMRELLRTLDKSTSRYWIQSGAEYGEKTTIWIYS